MTSVVYPFPETDPPDHSTGLWPFAGPLALLPVAPPYRCGKCRGVWWFGNQCSLFGWPYSPGDYQSRVVRQRRTVSGRGVRCFDGSERRSGLSIDFFSAAPAFRAPGTIS